MERPYNRLGATPGEEHRRRCRRLAATHCTTRRIVVGMALIAVVVAIAVTHLGQATVKSFTNRCTVTISVEGVAQCRRTHPRHHHHAAPDFPIDAVYTWVDPSDPDWQMKRHGIVGGTFGEFGIEMPSDRAGDLSDARRFNNMASTPTASSARRSSCCKRTCRGCATCGC